jgi:tetratricopeptide (TPR) repeat protein
MKFMLKKSGDGGAGAGKAKPQKSPDSTVSSSGSKPGFSFNLKESAESLAQKMKADALVQEANATEKKTTFLPSSTKNKHIAAATSLTKAAEAYKASGSNDDAGRAYQRAADIQKDKLKNPVDASKCLTDAGDALKKSNPKQSAYCYQSAAILLRNAGKENHARAVEARAVAAASPPKQPAALSKAAAAVQANPGDKKALKALEKEKKALTKKNKTLEKKNQSLKLKQQQQASNKKKNSTSSSSSGGGGGFMSSLTGIGKQPKKKTGMLSSFTNKK